VLAAAVLIVLAAAFLRFYRLHDVMPGLGHDEAVEVIEALNVAWYGTVPTTASPLATSEVLARVVQGVFFIFLGPYTFVGRLVSAFWGVLTVALIFQAGRAVARHSPQRTAAGLIAAASLAALIGHAVISRSVHRAVTLPACMAAAIWWLAQAWRTNRRRDFALAGLLWGLTLHTYLPGLMMIPALAVILAHQAVFGWRQLRQRLPGLGWMLLGMLPSLLALLALELQYPAPLYFRLSTARAGAAAGQGLEHLIASLPQRYLRALGGFWRDGGYDPKRGVAGVPMLNPALLTLLGVGVAACAVRFRRLGSIVLLSLLALMLLPLALSDTLTDGLRFSGEYPVAALLIGLGGAELLALLPHLHPALRAGTGGGKVGQLGGALVLSVILIVSGAGTFRALFAFYDNPDQWRSDHVYSFVWYFLTPRYDLAERLNKVSQPTYLPLDEFAFQTTRFVLASRYPTIRSFSDLGASGEPLDLPDGQVVMPRASLEGPAPTAYVLLLPPEPPRQLGEVLYLPALDADTATDLRDRATAEGEAWSAPRDGLLGYRLEIGGRANPFARLLIPPTPLWATFGGRLELVGWDAPRTLTPGQPAVVTLYWRASQRVRGDYYLYVHLLNRFGDGLTAGGDEVIGRWSLSPRTWRVGQVVPETRVFDVPADLAPGPYGLLIGLYPPFGDPLAVTGPAGEDLDVSYQLWPLRVAAPPTPLPDDRVAVQATLGDQVALEGYTLAREGEPVAFSDLRPGDAFTLTLYWRALAQMAQAYHVFIHVDSPHGAPLAAHDGLPQEGAYPTTIWEPGEVVATTHHLTLPPDAGEFSVRAGLYAWPDLVRLPVTQDGARTQDDRVRLWP